MWESGEESRAHLCAPFPDDYPRHSSIPGNLPHILDRGSLFAVDAALQALDSAGLGPGAGDARRFAIADGLALRAPGQATLFVPYGHTVARVLGVRGSAAEVAGADASGLAAIAHASRLVAMGVADVVLAGATQALQPPLLDALVERYWAAKEAPRPFDVAHAGALPAEAAAYLVVEAAGHAEERGARSVAAISGYAEIFDPLVEPLDVSDAAEAGRTMQAALGEAGFLQNQIDAIFSCADGRQRVDFAEAFAVRRVFGNHAYYASITAPAGVLGSALAASGPAHAILALEAMRHQRTPPIAGFATAEGDLEELAYVREAKDERLDCILVTALGLGGANAALVLERTP